MSVSVQRDRPTSQVVTLGFDEGLSNVGSRFLQAIGALTRADNCFYRDNDGGIYKLLIGQLKVSKSAFATLPISGSGHALFHLPFGNADDFLLVETLDVTKLSSLELKLWWLDANNPAAATYIANSTVPITGLTQTRILRMLDEVFMLQGVLNPILIRPASGGGLESNPWGMRPTDSGIEVTLCVDKPYHQIDAGGPIAFSTTGACDLMFTVTQAPGIVDVDQPPRYKQWLISTNDKEVGWMGTGPHTLITFSPSTTAPNPRDFNQPGFGFFASQHDEIAFDIWLAEVDSDDDIESGFPSDTDKLYYHPQLLDGKLGTLSGTTLDPTLSRTKPQTIKPETGRFNNALSRIFSGHGHRRAQVDGNQTAPYPAGVSLSGGIVTRVKIPLDVLKSNTTHLRVYLSASGGAWPAGGQVPNEHIFIAYARPTDTTIAANAGNGESSSIFFQIPPSEHGIPVAPWTCTIEADADLPVPPVSLGIEAADGNAYLFILRPYSVFTAAPTVPFPTVNVETAGELASINPRNIPPPRATMGAVFQDSLVVNDLDTPESVRWSPPGEPHYFPDDYVLKLEDSPTGLAAAGRFLFIGTRRSMHIARYLPTLDITDELTQEAFAQIDNAHGPAGPAVITTFSPPGGDIMCAFVDTVGRLWITNGGPCTLAAPQYQLDFGSAIANGTLVDNPAMSRLELCVPTDTPIAEGNLFRRVFYHYGNTREGGAFKVTGPNVFSPAPAIVAAASSHRNMWHLTKLLDLYLADQEPMRSDLMRLDTGVIAPLGLGVEFLVTNMRVLHGALAAGLLEPTLAQLTVHAEDANGLWHTPPLPLPVDREGVTPHLLGVSFPQGLHVSVLSYASGRLDAIEMDIEPSGPPRS